jgi:hypothetical protein
MSASEKKALEFLIDFAEISIATAGWDIDCVTGKIEPEAGPTH